MVKWLAVYAVIAALSAGCGDSGLADVAAVPASFGCPCVDGFECDVAKNVCVVKGTLADAGDVDAQNVAEVVDSADDSADVEVAAPVDTADTADAIAVAEADGQNPEDVSDVADTQKPEDANDVADTENVADVAADIDVAVAADASEEPIDSAVDVAAACTPGSCDDTNACTIDSCDAITGCIHAANSGLCDDSDACTVGDACKDSVCLPGAGTKCDDGNVCTTDSCDALAGCKHAANTLVCDDGNVCSLGDACTDTVCVPGAAKLCDDGNVCTDNGCDLWTGCNYFANAAACSDGDLCTVGDVCAKAVCLPGQATVCADGNVCTDDNCAKVLGCVYLANAATCSDGDACTVGEACDNTQCKGAVAKKCADGTVCTDDNCDKLKGCQNVNNTAACDSGVGCTKGDVCAGGKCIAGAVGCDDKNICTDDSCAANACKFTPNSASCDDANACTSADKCAAGACAGGAVVCDDKNLCTSDSCDKIKGCIFAPNNGNCDDSDACTTGDACAAGKCAGIIKNCGDLSACTVDSCVPVIGCQNLAISCDDSNVCTADNCDKLTGCVHAAVADGIACGGSALCKAGLCTGSGKCTDADLWQKTVGGAATDEAHAVADAGDGGYAVAGSTDAKGMGQDDLWLIRLDGAGKQLWDATYGTKESDIADAITRTTDGGYILGGWSWGGGLGLDDGYAVKVDKDGKQVWAKAYGGAGNDVFHAVVAMPDGGAVLGGRSSSGGAGGADGWLVRVNVAGVVVWNKQYGGAKDDELFGLDVKADGSVIAVGRTLSKGAGKNDGWIVRADALGVLVYDEPLGGLQDDQFNAIKLLPDGGLVAVGHTASDGAGGNDGWAVRMDKDGSQTWARTYGGAGADDLLGVATLGGEHIQAVGVLGTGANAPDTWLLSLDGSGIQQWQKSWGTAGVEDGRGLVMDANGVQVIVGTGDVVEKGGTAAQIRRVDAWGNATCVESGSCAGLKWDGCGDGNPCTSDLCDGLKGCGHASTSGSVCDDATFCTTNDVCASGTCAGKAAIWKDKSPGVNQGYDEFLSSVNDGGVIFRYPVIVGNSINAWGIRRVDAGGDVVSSTILPAGEQGVVSGFFCANSLGKVGGGGHDNSNQSRFALRWSASGSLEWKVKLGTTDQQSYGPCALSDIGHLFVIVPDVNGDPPQRHLLKFDGSGKLQWSTDVSGQANTIKLFGDLVVLTDNTMLAAYDQQSGAQKWSKLKSSLPCAGYQGWAQLDGDSTGLVFFGGALDEAQKPHECVMKIALSGEIIWSSILSNPDSNGKFFYTGRLLSDGGFSGFGTAESGCSPTFVRISSAGELIAKSAPFGNVCAGEVHGIRAANDGMFLKYSGNPWSLARIDAWGNMSGASPCPCLGLNVSACDDNNPCTTDSCDPKLGCTHTNNTNPCSDNNPCTFTDTCAAGACKGTPSPEPSCAMLPIPAKATTQGCNAAVDGDCAPDESPAHPVNLSTFTIDAKEVSDAQYAACVSAGKCTIPAASSGQCTYGKIGKDSFPVNCVTWDQANSFCKWAYADGRLPTEAEWERAARSTDARKYPWGNVEPDCTYADFTPAAGACFAGTKATGSYLPGKSADGLFDLAGNVSEWTADWYDVGYYAVAPASNPTGPADGTTRVVRGGGYQASAAGIRGGARDFADPTKTLPTLGFRCARSGN